eukprot:3820829-Rhodomonas_salina.1
MGYSEAGSSGSQRSGSGSKTEGPGQGCGVCEAKRLGVWEGGEWLAREGPEACTSSVSIASINSSAVSKNGSYASGNGRWRGNGGWPGQRGP